MLALALAATVDALRHEASLTRAVTPRATTALPTPIEARGRDGQVAAGSYCPSKRIELRYPDGRKIYSLRGCAPAWKPPPDGDLTFVRGGDVVEFEEPCRWERADCLRTILSRRSLDAQMRVAWGLPHAVFDVRALHWLARERLAAVVHPRARSRRDFVAVFRNGRLVHAHVPR